MFAPSKPGSLRSGKTAPWHNTLLLLWRSKQLNYSESGVTLIESLVAVVVVSILVASIAPMIALSVASRVQARRIDLAVQHGRSYSEGLQSKTLPIPNEYVAAGKCDLADVVAPAGALPVDVGTLVDTNNNGFSTDDVQDLVIQAIRSPSTCVGVNCIAQEGYQLLVRVYRADAFQGGNFPTGIGYGPVGTNPRQSFSQSTFTGTLGSKDEPLVIMKSSIPADDQESFEDAICVS
jgi:prepilin-type N-terminal cleavage/methylation domain-containing protein